MSMRCTAFLSVVATLAAACAGPTAAPQSASSGDEAAAAPATASVPGDLEGSWAQFWAPKGDADSPRYLLLADGRFGWTAARAAGGEGPQQMSGTWSRAGDVLTLQVERRRLADGSVGTPGEPATLPLQLGACPDNSEARAVDPGYACVSLDGQAYFRRPADGVEQAPFFE